MSITSQPEIGASDISDWVAPLQCAAPTSVGARAIAFYLPQFHAIPENDEWWGNGFTEWVNVRPAKPQFAGHYQPHIPSADIGYYDLTDPTVMQLQVRLAKTYGIEAFCFYSYWFAGKRLLEKPVEDFLSDTSLDFSYLICWANENWSRSWDGSADQILIAQDHSPEDDIAFIETHSRFLRDPRYFRIDGKPLLLVYRVELLPDPMATANRWREWCRQNGVGEIFLACVDSFESTHPESIGFDAEVEFPPNCADLLSVSYEFDVHDDFAGQIMDWNTIIRSTLARTQPDHLLFRGVVPSWDNTARRGTAARIFAGSTPGQYSNWLAQQIWSMQAEGLPSQKRLVFINAWNEWAEGAHLEPDTRFGYAWLEATRVALTRTATDDEPNYSAPIFVIDVTDFTGVPTFLGYAEIGDMLTYVICRPDQRSSIMEFSKAKQVVVAPDDAGTLELLSIVNSLELSGSTRIGRVLISDGDFEDDATLSVINSLKKLLKNDSSSNPIFYSTTDRKKEANLIPQIRDIVERLGLPLTAMASVENTPVGDFVCSLSDIRPLASLNFDIDGTSKFSRLQSSLLDAALSIALRYSVLSTYNPSLPPTDHEGLTLDKGVLERSSSVKHLLSAEVERLTEKTSDLRSQEFRLSSWIDDLHKTIEELRDEVERRGKAISDIQSDLQTELKLRSVIIDNTEAARAATYQYAKTLEHSLELQGAQLSAAQNHAHELEQHNHELDQKVSEIYASRTWKAGRAALIPAKVARRVTNRS